MDFYDTYLQKLSPDEKRLLEDKAAMWNKDKVEFSKLLTSWFSNFESREDKDLAFKVLKNIVYYSDTEFVKRMAQLFMPIEQHIYKAGKDRSNLLVVTPNTMSDSANRYPYDISKLWKLPEGNICRIDMLEEKLDSNSVLVAFNDTHGTGRQFIMGVWQELNKVWKLESMPTVFVVCITMAEKALNYFKHEFRDQPVKIIPSEPERSAREIFTAKEYDRLEEIGHQVYPTHPMGYGNSGLLSAYYFQCPNNTLPIIWADGANNQVNSNACPWTPLFPYKPKIKSSVAHSADQSINYVDYLTSVGGQLSDKEKIEVNQTISRWKCDHNFMIQQKTSIENWFKNFPNDKKRLALKIFNNTDYFSIARVRELIEDLRLKVLGELRSLGGDTSDILLVLTGYEKASVYHYVYDFLKIWHLKVEQTITLEEMKEYHALDKSLVYFYHTRSGSGEYFLENVWSKVKRMPVRRHYVISFSMSSETKNDLINEDHGKLKIFSSNAASRPISSIFSPEEIEELKTLLSEHSINLTSAIEDSLLIAYYFLYPKTISPVICDSSSSWQSLFKKLT